jgi:DNA invertase Pin-like site-specific DNA recombinase
VDQLKKKSAELRVLNSPIDTTSAHGQLQLQILAAFTEYKSAKKDRRREGIEDAKKKGVYVGRQPTTLKHAATVLEHVAQGIAKLRNNMDFR